MFQREAAWIAGELAALADAEFSPLLNLGSSSGAFRTEEQPWIERDLFQPLAARGVRVVHCDVKDQPGVDLVADLLDPAGRAAAAAVEPRAILCSNLLEHVPDPAAMLDACLDILPPGGVLIVTVPKSYPHHRDPIDTMYRPTPDQVFALIGERASRVSAAVLEPGSYRDDLRRRPWLLLRPLLRLPAPFLGLDKWKRSLGKLYWVFHPYQVTCLVARKT